MRHRARPSFTVEVKRGSKITRTTAIEADDIAVESRRIAEAALFGRSAPPPPERLNPERSDGGRREEAAKRPEAEGAPAHAPARRVLPDLVAVEAEEARAREHAAAIEAALQAERTARPRGRPPGSRPERVVAPPPALKALRDAEPRPARGRPKGSGAAASLPEPVRARREQAFVEPAVREEPSREQAFPGEPVAPRDRGSRRDQPELKAGERWMRRLPRFARPR